MAKLRVKSWENFQHYRDRRPAWIKLHKHLLDDYEFHRLPVASRALAPMLWLLASESKDGSIDYDVEKLAFRLRADKSEVEQGLEPLIAAGFFIVEHDASAPLSEPEQNDSESLAQRREEKRREEETRAGARDACSPSDLISAVGGVVQELWALPAWTPSGNPDTKTKRSSADFARDWIKAGMRPERLRELVREPLQRMVARKERPPSHLAYIDGMVQDALKADEARRVATTVTDSMRMQWEARLGVWRKGAEWLPGWGPAPFQPGCKVPGDLLTQEDRGRGKVVDFRRATA